MKIGLSGDAFGILILVSTILYVSLMIVMVVVAHKKGIDVTTHRFGLSVSLGGAVVFIFIPLLLTDLPIKPKIMILLFSLAVGLGNYFAVDRMSKSLKAYLEKDKEERK